MQYKNIPVSEQTKKKFDSAYFAAKSKHTGKSELNMDAFVLSLLKVKTKC